VCCCRKNIVRGPAFVTRAQSCLDVNPFKVGLQIDVIQLLEAVEPIFLSNDGSFLTKTCQRQDGISAYRKFSSWWTMSPSILFQFLSSTMEKNITTTEGIEWRCLRSQEAYPHQNITIWFMWPPYLENTRRAIIFVRLPLLFRFWKQRGVHF
jgi:hypothetical protein